MIIPIIAFLLMLLLLEFFILKQRSLYKSVFNAIQASRLNLEILKAVSYLPSTKTEDLNQILTQFSTYVLKNEAFTSFKALIFKEDGQTIDFISGGKLTDQEKGLLQDEIVLNGQTICVPIKHHTLKLGYFLLESKVELTGTQTHLLTVLSGALALIIRRIHFNKNIIFTDQLKALTLEW